MKLLLSFNWQKLFKTFYNNSIKRNVIKIYQELKKLLMINKKSKNKCIKARYKIIKQEIVLLQQFMTYMPVGVFALSYCSGEMHHVICFLKLRQIV